MKCIPCGVPDSPPKPRIDVSGVLREKQLVNVTCTAVVPCSLSPPQLSWNLHDSRRQTLRDADRVLVTQILTTIPLTDRSDGVNVTCVARYPVNGTSKTATQAKTLHVSCKASLFSLPSDQRLSYRLWPLLLVSPDAPKNTAVSVSPGGSLPAGSWVNLSCSSAAKPPIRKFTWFRTSRNGGGAKTKVSEGRVYGFNLTYGGVYRCEAENDYGTESSEVHLTIEGNHIGATGPQYYRLAQSWKINTEWMDGGQKLAHSNERRDSFSSATGSFKWKRYWDRSAAFVIAGNFPPRMNDSLTIRPDLRHRILQI